MVLESWQPLEPAYKSSHSPVKSHAPLQLAQRGDTVGGVGATVGKGLGAFVGSAVGILEGVEVGVELGTSEGVEDGTGVGAEVGA
jgi:hypothetical protein